MKFYGDIALNQNQLQKAVLELENDWPSSPKVGQLLFKNKIVYICIDVATGSPVWIPLTRELNCYFYMQPNALTTWTINHGLQCATPIVQVYDNDNKCIIPGGIEIVTDNQVIVTFGVGVAGRAVIVAGSVEGGPRSAYSFEWDQTSSSSTWTVIHSLGYLPIVRVFIGNQEVQPLSITHDSNFQVTITFSTPQVGMVKFI